MFNPTAEYLTQLVKSVCPSNGIEFLSAVISTIATPSELGILITELEIDQITNLTEGKVK